MRGDARLRGRLCLLLACTFACVLGVQSVLWRQLTRRLVGDADRYPSALVPRSAVPCIEGTPMQHWGTASYLAALQGREPRKLLLFNPGDRAAVSGEKPKIPIAPDEWGKVPPEPGPRGWFDFRPLLESLPREDRRGAAPSGEDAGP